MRQKPVKSGSNEAMIYFQIQNFARSEENHNYYLENSSFENFVRNREFHNYTIRIVLP